MQQQQIIRERKENKIVQFLEREQDLQWQNQKIQELKQKYVSDSAQKKG